MLSTYPAVAQTIPPALDTLDSLPLQDLAGLASISPMGSRFDVDLPDGTRCSSQNGTPTTLNFYSGISQRQDQIDQSSSLSQSLNGRGNGYAVGAILTVPLSTQTARNCDEAYEISILNKKIELASLLYEEGLITDEDLSKLLVQVKKAIID